MRIPMLAGKLHRVTVTGAELDYNGSCGIDADLLAAAGIRPYQKIEIYNVSNGERFETYAITEPAGSGEICVNGAAAHKASVGDTLIICAYVSVKAGGCDPWTPRIVHVTPENRPRNGD